MSTSRTTASHSRHTQSSRAERNTSTPHKGAFLILPPHIITPSHTLHLPQRLHQSLQRCLGWELRQDLAQHGSAGADAKAPQQRGQPIGQIVGVASQKERRQRTLSTEDMEAYLSPPRGHHQMEPRSIRRGALSLFPLFIDTARGVGVGV